MFPSIASIPGQKRRSPFDIVADHPPLGAVFYWHTEFKYNKKGFQLRRGKVLHFVEGNGPFRRNSQSQSSFEYSSRRTSSEKY